MHLVCTGSLTNAALLLTLFPEVAGSLVDITIMGGCLGPGNTHPVAEFNFQARLSHVHRSLQPPCQPDTPFTSAVYGI